MMSTERSRFRGLAGSHRRRFRSLVERLETRRVLSTLYVNASNTTGVQDGSQAHPFAHIQQALNASAPSGDTIRVAPGLYQESLTIAHSVNLLGPNAGINPNTATRGSEAILVPPTSNPASGNAILVTANNVTIDGLTIDGHNPNLTTGTLLNGITSNAARGISNVDPAGNLVAISGLTVQNDVIKDFTLFGVLADINDYSGPTLAVSGGNAIRNNLIDNVPTLGPQPGRGISIEDNFYADVTGNVLTRAATGIQAIFMISPNPTGAPAQISGNSVQQYNIGILLWTIDTNGPAFNVANNSLSAAPGASQANIGIELNRIVGTSVVGLTGNNVSGAHVGLQLQYTAAKPGLTVVGGTLANDDYGVLLTNAGAPATPSPTLAKLSGVSIVNPNSAGLDVIDALGNSAAPVTLSADAATTVTAAPHGAVISGTYAHLLDAGLPTVAFTATPPTSGASTSASFAFAANDNVTSTNDLSVRYSLDSAPYATAVNPLTLNGLAVGTHTLALQVTDQAGNVGTASYQWSVGNAPPPAPSVPVLDPASDSGISNSDGITNIKAPKLTGMAPAGSVVTVYAGATALGTTTATTNGAWSFTVGGAGSAVSALADGRYAITATDTDGKGNTSLPSPALTIVIDTTPPVIQVSVSPPPDATGLNTTDVVATYKASDALSGLVSPASGSFTFTANGSGQTHTFTVTDVAGNSASATAGPVNINKPVTHAWYVDAANTTGVEDGSQAHPFAHIQAALNASAPSGDTIRVAPGLYQESLTIAHSVNLLGPNAGINPNSASRGAEAILVPPTSNPASGNAILVTANNVTIDGLTIDGHNPNLTTGTLLNGITSNAARGISNVDPAGNLVAISGLIVQNDVIKDFTLFGVLADINDYSGPTLAVSGGNAIRNNLIDNVPTLGPQPGRGISIEDNFYADVTGNVITRAATGIQAIFMVSPNPNSAPAQIAGNTVQDYLFGILLWTIDSGSPAYTVSNNAVSPAPGASSTNVGIELDRILGSSGVTLSGNNVNGSHVGIELSYVPTSATVTVAGGTLSGDDYGVLVTNADATSPPASIVARLSSVSVVNPTIAGLAVTDAQGKSTAPVTLSVDAATTVTGAPHGVVISGTYAHLLDAGLPTVAFTATPPASGASTSATFAFTATDNVTSTNDLSVRYSLDSAPYATAISPLTFNGLAVGNHTLTLQVTDQAGNIGTASYQWTITSGASAPPRTAADLVALSSSGPAVAGGSVTTGPSQTPAVDHAGRRHHTATVVTTSDRERARVASLTHANSHPSGPRTHFSKTRRKLHP